MDPIITKALNDKVYDKRKSGALELEGLIRDALAAQDHDRIAKIVHQLCQEYAYAVHQPHARNGGLIGLAAASIALGPVKTSIYKADSYSDSRAHRKLLATSRKSCHQCSPASKMLMPVCGTMHARACTTSPKSPRGKYSYTLIMCLMHCARQVYGWQKKWTG